MSIHKRTTASGATRWDVRLRDGNGRTYNRAFRTRREAESYAAAERRKRDRGEWIDPRDARTTFRVWAEQWRVSDPTKRPKTRAADESTIRNHLVPALGGRPLGSIQRVDVQRLVNGWSDRYKPSTVRRYYATLRAILEAAVNADMIGRSPCRGIKLPTASPTPHPVVTAATVRQIAASIDPRYQAIVWLMAETGLRIGEVAGLRIGRLDLLHRTLSVEQTAQDAGGVVVYGPPKSAAGHRTLRLSQPLCGLMGRHLMAMGLTAGDRDEFVFPSPRGGPLRQPTFRTRFWLPAVMSAGCPDVRPHDLRRFSASAMARTGVDVPTATARMGHSDVRLTLGLYAQASDDLDAAAAEAIADYLARDGRAMEGVSGASTG